MLFVVIQDLRLQIKQNKLNLFQKMNEISTLLKKRPLNIRIMSWLLSLDQLTKFDLAQFSCLCLHGDAGSVS